MNISGINDEEKKTTALLNSRSQCGEKILLYQETVVFSFM